MGERPLADVRVSGLEDIMEHPVRIPDADLALAGRIQMGSSPETHIKTKKAALSCSLLGFGAGNRT